MPEPPDARAVQTSQFAGVNGVRLHYLETGRGPGRPLVVLLHGFPESGQTWRHQVGPLADAGLHVVAPDQRGYHPSDAPTRVSDYRIERLVDDAVGLVRHAGHERAAIVGHDWGGLVAWHVAMRRPEVVSRLVVLNAPHPAAYRRELLRTSQWRRSAYALFFQLPGLPEALLRAGDFAILRRVFRHDPARRDAYDERDVGANIGAIEPRRALSGALNYYRAALRWRDVARPVGRIAAPTLLIWGERDRYLVPQLADGLEPWVPDLRVERLTSAGHWVHRDEPARVAGLIREFVAPPDASRSPGAASNR